MVRAKFVVSSITEYADNSEIKLIPVTTGSEENKTFWKYTPSGSVSINCMNKDASNQFEVGKEYYVDFTPADKICPKSECV